MAEAGCSDAQIQAVTGHKTTEMYRSIEGGQINEKVVRWLNPKEPIFDYLKQNQNKPRKGNQLWNEGKNR